ncbi:hypothetical protein CRM22_009601 [Opisthorchis felineus]|uniref:Sulfotransferase domain-containing protein n=1 Tax=Opisthorchis felineus TaxID=147828 RepID=A0A4S2LD86_OPIFE|nr:hypothetical protein CRM22_009601 [Opisthorchis felineus]
MSKTANQTSSPAYDIYYANHGVQRHQYQFELCFIAVKLLFVMFKVDLPLDHEGTQAQDKGFSAEGPLLVIGAGVGRTGTTSLKHAFEIIYGQPCYHGYELIERHPEHCSKWLEIDHLLSNSPENDESIDPSLFRQIYRGFRSGTDIPTSCYYKQLMKVYPDVKVVLTTRDSQEWLTSARQTIFPRVPDVPTSWVGILACQLLVGMGFLRVKSRCSQRMLGPQPDRDDDRKLLEAYERWNAQVKQVVPAKRLLVYNIREGWGPLCKFLNVPIPNEPFPCTNDQTIVARIKRKIDRLTMVLRCTAVGTAVLICCYLTYRRLGASR